MLLDELRTPVEELAPRRTGTRRTPARRLATAPALAALAAG